jgi:hypothetical protein
MSLAKASEEAGGFASSNTPPGASASAPHWRGWVWAVTVLLVAAAVIVGMPQFRHKIFAASGHTRTGNTGTGNSGGGPYGASGGIAPETSTPSAQTSWQSICSTMVQANGGGWVSTDSLGNQANVTICGYSVSGTDLKGTAAPAGQTVIDFVVAVTDNQSDRPTTATFDSWSGGGGMVVAPTGTSGAECAEPYDGWFSESWSGCGPLTNAARLDSNGNYSVVTNMTVNPGPFSMFILASSAVPESFANSTLALFIDVPGSQFSEQGSGEGQQNLPLTQYAGAPAGG